MKKNTLLFILPIASVLTLSSCNTMDFVNHGEVTYYYIDSGNDYHIGDIPNNDLKFDLHLTYEDGYQKVIKNQKPFVLSGIISESGGSLNKSSPFSYSGWYTCRADLNYKDDVYTTTTARFFVLSGFEDGYTLDSFTLENKHTYAVGEVLADVLDLNVVYNWKNHGSENAKYIGSRMTLNIQKDGSGSYDITQALTAGSYTISATCNGKNASTTFNVNTGFTRINKSNLRYRQKNLDNDVSPATGVAKTLIVPITLSGSWTNEWTEAKLAAIKSFMFEGQDDHTYKNYYETASFRSLIVDGFVTEPYRETSSNLTTDKIQTDTSYSSLFTLIANAVEWAKTKYANVDWSAYDSDNNGTIDNIHLCTNFNTAEYSRQTGENVWNTPLWPHKYQTNRTGTHASPKANVYSIDAIDHFTDPITAIHEQGHIHGLDDYYDYNYSGADYIGYGDMQSYNVFDWNSYSKMSVGWVSPYVIDGSSNSVTITLGAAALTGDCLVIPANYSTWNQSAFDEYFLIELFSNCGLNTKDWSSWSKNFADLAGGGVRLYHVDSRILNSSGQEGAPSYNYYTRTNNSRPESNPGQGRLSDFPLLRLIQAGKVDTFGSTSTSAHHYVGYEDLFHTGDVFTFNEYKHMLSKWGNTVTTMDNGETFPYTISFNEVTSRYVTLTVSK